MEKRCHNSRRAIGDGLTKIKLSAESDEFDITIDVTNQGRLCPSRNGRDFSSTPAVQRQKYAVRACIIFNPTAKGDKAKHFLRHLGEIGAECVLKKTSGPGDARKLAADAVCEGFETVVAAGGDGTLNEVLNGIGDAPDGFQRARLGFLPLGTVNVFARELGISTRLEAALQTLRQGRETLIDLPGVEFTGNGARTRRYFAQLAGAGLDALAIELVSWQHKKKIGPLAYVIAGLKALRQPQFQISVSDGQRNVTGELVLIGNGRLYGGDFEIFPGADLRDGLLDACVFPRANWRLLARCGPKLLLQKKLPQDAAVHLRAASFTLTSSPAAPMEIDGELSGHLPGMFSVERSRLRVIVP
jgi:diacylglycerol kinase (ATP)